MLSKIWQGSHFLFYFLKNRLFTKANCFLLYFTKIEGSDTPWTIYKMSRAGQNSLPNHQRLRTFKDSSIVQDFRSVLVLAPSNLTPTLLVSPGSHERGHSSKSFDIICKFVSPKCLTNLSHKISYRLASKEP